VELDQVTARGRMLAEYDRAAWQATDAVLATHPPSQSGQTYVCRKAEQVWSCAFGVLAPGKERFLIWYEATQENSNAPFQVKRNDPPQEDTGFVLSGARALALARKDFQSTAQQRPYNASVVPAGSEQLYVYIVPAQTQDGVYLLGGDARYLVSKDGNEIIEKRQLHKTILEMKASPPGVKEAAGYHTHVLSDLPEDTDVFYVLTRKPAIPEYIAAGKLRYVVQGDGTVTRAK
jgi:hypothetical protein